MLKNLKVSFLSSITTQTKMFKENFGLPVFNYYDIMGKYEGFVEKWRRLGRPQLYFTTMDIEKCYDNVNYNKLCEFLDKSDLLVSFAHDLAGEGVFLAEVPRAQA